MSTNKLLDQITLPLSATAIDRDKVILSSSTTGPKTTIESAQSISGGTDWSTGWSTAGWAPICITYPNPATPTKLTAQIEYDSSLFKNRPTDEDAYIKRRLAGKLAKILIEEDLIDIQVSKTIEGTQSARAILKIIQE